MLKGHEPHFSVPSRVDDAGDVRYCDSGFRDIGGSREGFSFMIRLLSGQFTYHNFPDTWRWYVKCGALVFGGNTGM